MQQADIWILVIGSLCAVSCALLGNFLVLRKMSMMGDAISHAVLPGIAAGFVLTGTRASLAMFIGAAVTGLATALFSQWVHRFGKVDRGAAMGVVFTTLFAIGLILIVQAADHVDLDPDCVLNGDIVYAIWDTVTVGSVTLPRSILVLGPVLLVNTVFVSLFYKELKISSFDPALAATQGIHPDFMHYVLMTLVAVTTVASFETIGSILVIAMLIVPPATAYLLTSRLWVMILLSVVFAILAAGLGFWSAVTIPVWFGAPETEISGAMATVAGVLFAIVMMLAPRHGIISKVIQRVRMRFRILREDILGLMYRIDETGPQGQHDTTARELFEALGTHSVFARLGLATLRAGRLLERVDGVIRLTESGKAKAASIVRSHRLWETYFDQHLPLPKDHLHAPAERLEHITDPAMQSHLDLATGEVTQDPHGKRVPGPDEILNMERK